MATTITRTGGDTVIARTGLTDITITSTSDVEITYNDAELWINILVIGANEPPIALEVDDITTVNGVDVTGYTIEQLVTYIADNCFGIVDELTDLTITGTLSVGGLTNARLGVRGTTNDSTAFSFEAANLAGSTKFIVRNDGLLIAPTLPTSAAGLPSGGIWNDGGTLKIV